MFRSWCLDTKNIGRRKLYMCRLSQADSFGNLEIIGRITAEIKKTRLKITRQISLILLEAFANTANFADPIRDDLPNASDIY